MLTIAVFATSILNYFEIEMFLWNDEYDSFETWGRHVTRWAVDSLGIGKKKLWGENFCGNGSFNNIYGKCFCVGKSGLVSQYSEEMAM